VSRGASDKEEIEMQASKINVGDVYAIKIHDPVNKEAPELRRFTVTSVTTVINGDRKSPHNHKSTVQGYVSEGGQRGGMQSLSPELILGPYVDYKELVEREAKEKSERSRLIALEVERALAVRVMLYRFVGQPLPNVDPKHHGQAFRVSYSGRDIDMGEGGVALLHKALSELDAEVA
jgi:hypothetical protein